MPGTREGTLTQPLPERSTPSLCPEVTGRKPPSLWPLKWACFPAWGPSESEVQGNWDGLLSLNPPNPRTQHGGKA